MTSAVATATSLLGMWFFVVIIVCIMELYTGTNWNIAYKIGFRGQYCNRSEYVRFDKWSEYDWYNEHENLSNSDRDL